MPRYYGVILTTISLLIASHVGAVDTLKSGGVGQPLHWYVKSGGELKGLSKWIKKDGVLIRPGEADIACDGSSWLAGAIESFESGTGAFCTTGLTISGTTGIDTYSTTAARFGTHSLKLSDSSTITPDHVTVDFSAPVTSEILEMYISIPDMGTNGNRFAFGGWAKYSTAAQSTVEVAQVTTAGVHHLRFASATTYGIPVTPGDMVKVRLTVSDADGSGGGGRTMTISAWDSAGARLVSSEGAGIYSLSYTSSTDQTRYWHFWPATNADYNIDVYVDGFARVIQ